MFVTNRGFDDRILILVTFLGVSARRQCKKIEDVGDETGENLETVTNIDLALLISR